MEHNNLVLSYKDSDKIDSPNCDFNDFSNVNELRQYSVVTLPDGNTQMYYHPEFYLKLRKYMQIIIMGDNERYQPVIDEEYIKNLWRVLQPYGTICTTDIDCNFYKVLISNMHFAKYFESNKPNIYTKKDVPVLLWLCQRKSGPGEGSLSPEEQVKGIEKYFNNQTIIYEFLTPGLGNCALPRLACKMVKPTINETMDHFLTFINGNEDMNKYIQEPLASIQEDYNEDDYNKGKFIKTSSIDMNFLKSFHNFISSHQSYYDYIYVSGCPKFIFKNSEGMLKDFYLIMKEKGMLILYPELPDRILIRDIKDNLLKSNIDFYFDKIDQLRLPSGEYIDDPEHRLKYIKKELADRTEFDMWYARYLKYKSKYLKLKKLIK